ncbi:MAG: Glu-tRNA(Gln) amidotransferase subunit GatD [Candidatus Micrarchaeota archaeon]
MYYSEELSKALKGIGAEIGDRLRVTQAGRVYEGILMPRIELGCRNALVLKLPNGYNVGVRYEGARIEKLEGGASIEFVRKEEIEMKRTPGKPNVSIISTGGTIASRIDYKTGGVYAAFGTSDLLAATPELKDIANLKSELLFGLMSEDMRPEHWKKIAHRVAKELNAGADGVIVTHGTDTMHFTSAALSFMLSGLGKPVVLTGAQRSSDRGSSEAFMNIICSTWFAARADVAEVSLLMHASMSDDFCYAHRGTKVRKMHASRRDAFRSINETPIAKVFSDGRIEMLGACKKRGDSEVKVEDELEEKVALIKVYPGVNPEVMDFYIGRGYKGIVIEGTGMGHVPTTIKEFSLIPKIKEASDKGIPVCITTQCLYGRVHSSVYANQREILKAGGIHCEDMLPEVAYIKLMWALGKSRNFEEVKKLMLTPVAGEITERSTADEFPE